MKSHFAYPGAGHFLALVRKFDWPPGYEPQPILAGRIGPQVKANAAKKRAKQMALGDMGIVKKRVRKIRAKL